mmetsp:Transcript_16234/g.61542  ORF Transcript_16234/g.61542 Transcript_16234/m.61542 type:complete len:456 (+) Transcript_16234:24-1391(+)
MLLPRPAPHTLERSLACCAPERERWQAARGGTRINAALHGRSAAWTTASLGAGGHRLLLQDGVGVLLDFATRPVRLAADALPAARAGLDCCVGRVVVHEGRGQRAGVLDQLLVADGLLLEGGASVAHDGQVLVVGQGEGLADGGGASAAALDVEAVEDVLETRHQGTHVGERVERGGSHAEALGPARHGGEVDGLDVDVVVGQEDVRGHLGLAGIANEQRDDVGHAVEEGKACIDEHALEVLRVGVHDAPLPVGLLEVAHRGGSARGHHGRDGGGENEAGRLEPHGVHHGGRAGDVAAHEAVGLPEGAGDHGQAAEHAVALRNTSAAVAVEADCVDLIAKGHGPELVSEVADLLQGGDGALHAVDGFEGDELRRVRGEGLQDLAEVPKVVVVVHMALGSGVADALDHRRVVHCVGEDDEAREHLGERGEDGFVANIAAREEERRFGAVQVCELAL